MKPIAGSTSKPTAPASGAGPSNINSATRHKTTPKPVQRGQARDYGALWQYEATPQAWLPGGADQQVLLEILDDATRLNPGARLYPGETLLAHFDFLARVFQARGLPLALYVDYHSFFYAHNPDAFTQLGAAPHFYGVQLRCAPTPQAKGKIERRHDYWQKRLVPLLAADHIVELVGANHLLDQLVPHANQHESHRELGQTPHAAHQPAFAEQRSVIRPALPVVALRLEPANPRPRRGRRPSPRRLATPVLGRPTPHHRHPLPPPRWRHLLPPLRPRSKSQTHRPPPLPGVLKPF